MATTIDELQVLITAQTDGLRREVSKVDSQLSGLSKITGRQTESMSDSFSRVGKFGVRTLQVGVVAAVGAIAASIPGAVRRIDTLVAFPRVLEAMGATSEQAAKATQTLSDRLTGLPTPLQDGAAGVQALVAAGLGVEEATDVFLAFNNATLAASTEAGAAQGAFTQLVQSISKGKIEGQEWNSMVSAMPTAFQALSKESGLTREELRELYRTDPQKLLDDLTRLDKEGGGGLASLDEQARAATGGIGTSFDNMKNSIVRGLEGIVAKLGDGSLEEGQKKISDMITKVGKAFEKALDFIGEVVAYIMDNKDIFGSLAVGIGVLVGAITAATIAMGIFNAVMAINPIALIVMAVAALVAGLVYFFTQTETGQAIWAAFTEFMGAAWEAIKGFFIGAWEAIQGAWNNAVSFYTGIWKGISSAFNAVVDFFTNIFTAAWGAVKAVWSAAIGFYSGIWSGITGVFSSVASWFGDMFGRAWGLVKSAWSGATGWFGSVFNGIVNFFAQIPGRITSFFSSAWGSVKGIWSGAGGWFNGVINNIFGFFAGIPGKIKGYFTNALNAVKNINWVGLGRNIVDGIASGLSPGKIVEKMKSIASSALDTVKSFLGIKSPSRVMRDQVGKMMGEGMAIGIDQSTSSAMRSAANSSKRVLGAYSGSFNANMPTAAQLNSSLEITANHSPMDIGGRQTPVNVQIDGQTLLSFVIDGVNNRAFVTNSPAIDF